MSEKRPSGKSTVNNAMAYILIAAYALMIVGFAIDGLVQRLSQVH